MQRQPRGAGFDGPGARPILGEPGPSSSAAAKSPSVTAASELSSPHYHDRDRPSYPWKSEQHSEYPSRQPYPSSPEARLISRQDPSPPRQLGHPHLSPQRRSYPPHDSSGRPTSSSHTTVPSSSPTTTAATTMTAAPAVKRVGGKANVSSACGPCKRAHLACDVARPCKRCVTVGKEDQCEDVPVSQMAADP